MTVRQKARVVTINNEETALISAADSMSTRKDSCAVNSRVCTNHTLHRLATSAGETKESTG